MGPDDFQPRSCDRIVFGRCLRPRVNGVDQSEQKRRLPRNCGQDSPTRTYAASNRARPSAHPASISVVGECNRSLKWVSGIQDEGRCSSQLCTAPYGLSHDGRYLHPEVAHEFLKRRHCRYFVLVNGP